MWNNSLKYELIDLNNKEHTNALFLLMDNYIDILGVFHGTLDIDRYLL